MRRQYGTDHAVVDDHRVGYRNEYLRAAHQHGQCRRVFPGNPAQPTGGHAFKGQRHFLGRRQVGTETVAHGRYHHAAMIGHPDVGPGLDIAEDGRERPPGGRCHHVCRRFGSTDRKRWQQIGIGEIENGQTSGASGSFWMQQGTAVGFEVVQCVLRARSSRRALRARSLEESTPERRRDERRLSDQGRFGLAYEGALVET